MGGGRVFDVVPRCVLDVLAPKGRLVVLLPRFLTRRGSFPLVARPRYWIGISVARRPPVRAAEETHQIARRSRNKVKENCDEKVLHDVWHASR